MRENGAELFTRIKTARMRNEWWPGPMDLAVKEFFAGSREEWERFAAQIRHKTCLEIGAGPCGALAIWWWVKRRIVVDPLVQEYKRIAQQLFKSTWYSDDMELFAQPAERFIPELSGRISGVIICRNMLDHSESPMTILKNVAEYAGPGCYLLLWTDLWHLKGHSKGHRNITRDARAFEKKIMESGFDILHAFDSVRPDGSTIEYGCRARKRIVADRSRDELSP